MAELNPGSGGNHKHDGKVKAKKHSTKVDMTPMVDLAFLLLTFFVLTSTFSKPKTMEITFPVPPPPGVPIATHESKWLHFFANQRKSCFLVCRRV
jgi:hypothetical protein